MMKIYLAGKVGGAKWSAITKHPYVEYVASDGHTHCEHDWGHGVFTFGDESLRLEVANRCTGKIAVCDFLFAYLDTPDSYGSIAEIAYASALGKPCFVMINDDSEDSDSIMQIDDDADLPELVIDGFWDAYWLVSCFPSIKIMHEHKLPIDHVASRFKALTLSLLLESPIESNFFGSYVKHYGVDSSPIPQWPINGYRLDFAFPNEKVAIELDGHEYHKTPEQRTYDAKRDRTLLKDGWVTVRYTGSEVHKDAESIVAEVHSLWESRQVSPTPEA